MNSRIIWDVDSNKVQAVAQWTTPPKVDSDKGDAVVTFSLPFYDKEQKMNVLAIDVSLALLSKIVLEEKPSPNSTCALLAKDGTVIVYNKSDMLDQNLITLAKKYYHPSVIEAAEAMLAGETGYK
jgi:methyl-accepting chemotaxis protein/sigma-B regulation protein RsbU (phosphoserine phosphatase)